ncbi:MAG: hypothetical protein IJ743_04535 [Bacilli bacterium]|nr:hypothetical protein [Bacilli bacterium]
MLENEKKVEGISTEEIADNYVSKEEYNHLKDERDEYRSISLELAETVKVLRDQLKATGGVVSE